MERLIGPRTRAVCLSLVNYGHGFRAPIEAIGEICRRHGVWLVVDAIMALGTLRVDAAAIGADIISAHGYKFLWLVARYGVAICYVLGAGAPWSCGSPKCGLQGHGGRDGIRTPTAGFRGDGGTEAPIRGYGAAVRCSRGRKPWR